MRPRNAKLQALKAAGTAALLLPALGGAEPPAQAPPIFPAMQRIPGGQLVIGSSYAELAQAAEQCNRAVGRPVCEPDDFRDELNDSDPEAIETFWLDRTEVTVAEYGRCVVAGWCREPLREMPGPQLPVAFVSQQDAASFCAHLGKRLPTEAEFEWAARGPTKRRYPWGSIFHSGRTNGGQFGPARTNADDGYELWAPSVTFPSGRTPQGVRNLAGNVAEWTATRYHRYGNSARDPRVVVRGGHFASPPWELRSAHRWPVAESSRVATIGFRCALGEPVGP